MTQLRNVLALSVVLAASGTAFAQSRGGERQKGAQPAAAKTEIQALRVQGSVYMLTGAGGNVTVQLGDDGVLVVDTGLANAAPDLLASIRKLSDRPIAWVINTHIHPDHTGGNELFFRSGVPVSSGGSLGSDPGGMRIVAHQSVFDRMSAEPAGDEPRIAEAAWPNDAYSGVSKDFYFNGEAVIVQHLPTAHTDGDSIVFFRRSDVISTGDLFVPGRYPLIDVRRGGSVQGVIDALNRILELAVPARYQEGGTYVIPGHGRLCDEADVVEYRDMLTIIRDRMRDMIGKGMTLEQVKAAGPTKDYDSEYGADSGRWTTAMFIEAVYESVKSQSADRAAR
jgi:cyclase